MDRFPHRNREDREAANDVLDFDPQEETSGSDDAMDVAMSVNGERINSIAPTSASAVNIFFLLCQVNLSCRGCLFIIAVCFAVDDT